MLVVDFIAQILDQKEKYLHRRLHLYRGRHESRINFARSEKNEKRNFFETFYWTKLVLNLNLYVQIGVRLPRYTDGTY